MHETYRHACYIEVFTHFTHKYNYEEKQYSTFSFMVLWYIVSWKPFGRNTKNSESR